MRLRMHLSRLTLILAASIASIVLVACSANPRMELEVQDGQLTQDGVTVRLERATATYVDDPGAHDYTFDVTIENGSDEGVMQVIYSITTIGEDGEEIRTFGTVYDQEDRAIAPGEKVSEHLESRWGPAVPASVSLSALTVTFESELPSVQLPQQGQLLYQALGNEKLANITSEPPVAMSFHIDEGGAGRTATFTQGSSLDQAIELFCDIRIGRESTEFVTDNYNWISFTWEDGSTTFISLNLRNLEIEAHPNKWHSYELENLDAFWNYAASAAVED